MGGPLFRPSARRETVPFMFSLMRKQVLEWRFMRPCNRYAPILTLALIAATTNSRATS
jgi:hypothetical protein